MRKYLGLLIALLLLVLGDSAEAAVQIFDFTFVGTNIHPTFTDYPGTVTGFLTFATTDVDILPISVTITSAPAGLGLAGTTFTPTSNTGSFDVSETTLTVHGSTVSLIDGSHLYNLAFGKDSGTQNYLLDLGPDSGITGNDDGSNGVVFTPESVPEPSAEGLMVLGLGAIGLGFVRRKSATF